MQNTDCLSRISHELRNPLTLIYSSLQLLEHECPAVSESGLWPQILRDMQDTIRLLQDLTASQGNLSRHPLPIAEFMNGLAESFAPAARIRQIHFDMQVSGELSGAVLMADRQKLRQAATNLFINAVDAAASVPSGEPAASPGICKTKPSAGTRTAASGEVTLSAIKEGPDVCIHIRDNGPGIPRERLATLFHSYVTYKPNGFGLGLGTSLSIAQQHGGSLTVDTCTARKDDASLAGVSAVSRQSYTDFCLRLPLLPAAAPATRS